MVASILAALKAIPEVVGLIKQAIGAINALVAAYEKAQQDKWINEGKEIAHAIGLAKTDLERAELVKKLRNQWTNMP